MKPLFYTLKQIILTAVLFTVTNGTNAQNLDCTTCPSGAQIEPVPVVFSMTTGTATIQKLGPGPGATPTSYRIGGTYQAFNTNINIGTGGTTVYSNGHCNEFIITSGTFEYLRVTYGSTTVALTANGTVLGFTSFYIPMSLQQTTWWGREDYTKDATTATNDTYVATCSDKSLKLGAGAYQELILDPATYYSFSWANTSTSTDQCNVTIAGGGAGSDGAFSLAGGGSTTWYSGSQTTTLRILARRSNCAWTKDVGSTFTYRKTTPSLTANSPTTITSCVSPVSIAAGTVTNGTSYWQGTTSNGTSTSTPSTPNNANATGTWYYRPGNNGCWGTQQSTSVTIVPQIVAPTLNVKTPNNTNVCAGTSVNATINAGSGGSGAADTYQYRTNGGSWVAYTSGTSISTTGVSSVDIQVSRSAGTGSGCNATGPTIIASWTVNPQIVAPTLNVKTPNNTNVCAGTSVNATITAGSGGSGASDTYEYRTDGGSWLAYTSGAGISTSGISSVDIRVSRSAGTGSGCNATGPTIIASWTVNPQIVTPTLNVKTPNNTNVCAGTSVNATITAGSGGSGASDTYEYRTDAGSWLPYTNGAGISTSGISSVDIRVSRSAGTGSGCNATGPTIIASWTVNPQIVAPTLNVKTPNNTNVCAGTSVNATINAGSGGSGASDTYEYRTDAGSWLPYTNGAGISTSGISSVDIRVSRSAGTGSGCNATGPTIIASWIVDPTSVGGTASANQVICPNNPPTALTLIGNTGSIQWQSSPDNSTWTNITGATATPLTVAQMGGTLSSTTYYKAVVTSGVCTAANSNVVVVYTNDDDASGTIASSSSTRICIVNDNNWHYFRNSSGDIIAAINSQGEDLGNVTMTVNIETVSHDGGYLSPKHGDGGLGRNQACKVLPELSVRRWYEISPQWQNYEHGNSSTPTLIRLFLDPSDYSNYIGELLTWHSVLGNNAPNSYAFCYGTTNTIVDLAVSRNELKDVPIASTSSSGGPGSVAQYELSRDSLSRYRFHTNGGIGGPLPIELLSFTGYNEDLKNVLNWITASEINTNKFEVQRSIDAITWETIGEVQATGSKDRITSYTYNDENSEAGLDYYRLKIIDNDQSFEYSFIIKLDIHEKSLEDAITQVFPNPTSGKLNIILTSTKEQEVSFNIIDILGRIDKAFLVDLVKGVNKLEFNFDDLNPGTYLISYRDANGKKHFHKFMKE